MVPDGFKDWAKRSAPARSWSKTSTRRADPAQEARPYWKEGKGLLDGVDVTVINDGSARLNA